MLSGLSGTLISLDFAEHVLPSALHGRFGEGTREAAHRNLGAWWQAVVRSYGPASSLRGIVDGAAVPLFRRLGYRVAFDSIAPGRFTQVSLLARDRIAAAGVLTAWDEDLSRVWRDGVRAGGTHETRWCFCFNGRQLRLVDGTRAFARAWLQFDLDAAFCDESAFGIFWGLLRADALLTSADGRSAIDAGDGSSLIEDVLRLSDQHALAVCASLQEGVHRTLCELIGGMLQALPRRTRHTAALPLPDLFEQSLTVIYRLLFLLFAEARGLLPVWHPTYRESYSMEAIRTVAERSPAAVGIWEAVQAVSRMAHEGCRAGDLLVTAFNGRLFAPARTPLAETMRIPDAWVGRALMALTTRDIAGGRRRIAYHDLDVEQLGAVYEGVLDYTPEIAPPTPPAPPAPPAPTVFLRSGTGRRKATGTFYTPRSITDYLVRQTLHPLVSGAPPDAILSLRVLDPAMGSGAFLVSACRYLAAAYERALIETGACTTADITLEDRAGFRRTIAQRTLYGVDLNPMAVQLARLSLWLTTLAAAKPLTFLDHRLRAGDSLVGASLYDIARRPPPGPGTKRARHPVALPLFESSHFSATIGSARQLRDRVAIEPGDTLEAVRNKERTLDRLNAPGSSVSRWKSVADLWCACWFWDTADAPPAAAFAPLTDALLQGTGTLPRHVAQPWLARSQEIAAAQSFFHWETEFPEAFFDQTGNRLPDPGFDAVLGNPPWDMVRADAGSAADRREQRSTGARLLRFFRESGVYTAQSDGHANRYQLFLERALSLLRSGGRIGMVLPGGLAIDHGCAALRHRLLIHCDLDTIVGFENRDAIFPIHRSMRFLLVTATTGGATAAIRCRFGTRAPEALDSLEPPAPLLLSPSLIRRLSGEQLAIPDIRHPLDIEILERIASDFAPLGDREGWCVRFGRELNATEDRMHFVQKPGRGLPVLEGKLIQPFRIALESVRHVIPLESARRLLDPGATFERPRLAYRDVASSSNRLTLIAAIVPAGSVTTHTLFCLKTDLPIEQQWFLCGVLNSFVANYVVRTRVSTHVTVTIVESLPVPRPQQEDAGFQSIVAAARRLARPGHTNTVSIAAALQADVARLYGLSRQQFSHILETFPLVPAAERATALDAFDVRAG